MAVAVTAAHGAIVKLHNSGSFQTIDGVHNGPSGPGFNPQMIQARHHGSPDIIQKVSIIEKTPVSFDIYYDSNDTIHAALRAAAAAGTRSQFEITLTDTGAEKYTFYAFVSLTFSGQVDGFNVMSVNLTIDGGITVT